MTIGRTTVLDAMVLLAIAAAVPVGFFLLRIGLYSHAAWAWGAGIVGAASLIGFPYALRESRTALSTVRRAPPSMAGAHLQVVTVTGECVFNYSSGQIWTIDQRGALNRPLCRPAMMALRRVTTAPAAPEPLGETLLNCACPLRKAQVEFRLQAA